MKPSHFVPFLLLLISLLPAGASADTPSAAERLTQLIQVKAVRLGDRGEQVAELQRLLLERGFSPGSVDGKFGPQTERAVMAAQAQYGLEQDGLAGRMTVAALRSGPLAAANSTEPADPSTGLVLYQATTQPRQSVTPPMQAATTVKPSPATRTVATQREAVALTFNGLPEEQALAQILEALATQQMQATFFVSGEEAEAAPELLRQIHEAGHEIGSLGYGAIDMRRLSPITAQALLKRTSRAIEAVTGQTPQYFRPPLGRFDRNLIRLAGEEGMSLVLWSNIGLLPEPEVEAERLAEAVADGLFPRAVLMLPLDKPNALAAVPTLIEQMVAEGFQSQRLGRLLAAPAAVGSSSQPVTPG